MHKWFSFRAINCNILLMFLTQTFLSYIYKYFSFVLNESVVSTFCPCFNSDDLTLGRFFLSCC